MSLIDVFLGSECGVDVYEESNEETWVKCAVDKGRYTTYVMVPIIIVVILLFIVFGSTSAKIIATLSGLALIGLLSIGVFYLNDKAARVEFQRSRKEIKSRMDAGMDKATAIQQIQQERLSRENTAAMRAYNRR